MVILRAFTKKTEKTNRRDRSSAAKGLGTEAMTKIGDLHRRWSKDADYKDAYDALGGEFDLARVLIEPITGMLGVASAAGARPSSNAGGLVQVQQILIGGPRIAERFPKWRRRCRSP